MLATKKPRFLLFFLCVAYCYIVLNNTITAQSNTVKKCDCVSTFNYLLQKTQTDYVGYADKVSTQGDSLFTFINTQKKKAKKAKTTVDCLQILNDWIDFFNDKHFRLILDPNLTKNQIRELFQDSEKITMSEEDLKKYLLAKPRMALEGIWQDASNQYRIGIIKTDRNVYTGFVLKADSVFWMPGQVKMRLEKVANDDKFNVTLYRRDHLRLPINPIVWEGIIQAKEITWYKFYPGPTSSSATHTNAKQPSETQRSTRLNFERLNPETALLTVPSFQLAQKSKIDSLIRLYEQELRNVTNLIIDIRFNTGGNNSSFENILKYIYTKPIQIDGGNFLASDENIRLYKKSVQENYPLFTEKQKTLANERIYKIEKDRGNRVAISRDSTIILDTVFPHPKKVFILINEYTASSAEFFILRARQSDKVTILSQPTMGAVDYVEYLEDDKFPLPFVRLHYSATKTTRLTKNPTADLHLQPDVYLPYEKDWVKEVLQLINKSKTTN